MLDKLSRPLRVVRPLVRAVYPKRHTDIASLVATQGYLVHRHTVTTDDGYCLEIHRLALDSAAHESRRPVVYFHHGLLTNSELFVLGDRKERSLPYVLLERGYDVWLGNNRGNKYSTHKDYDQSDPRYWDFSIDEFAKYDIPSIINYITTTTEQPKITYVGFSQGTTQLFASLAINPWLNDKIGLFVALSPVMVPQPLTHPLIKPFVDNPSHLGIIFGSGPMLPFVDFVNKLIPQQAYKTMVDLSLRLLFNTNGSNISSQQKLAGYPYLFSISSVKCVTHWFQIIRQQSFHKYYDTTLNKALGTTWKVQNFELDQVKVPCFLVYGDADILVDIDKTLSNLASTSLDVSTLKIESYEHMDTLWADDCIEKVFTPVVERIDKTRQQAQQQESAGSVFL